MKFKTGFIVATLLFAAVNASGAGRRLSPGAVSTSGPRGFSEHAVNVRLFPLNFYSSSIHVGAEIRLGRKWAIGAEASIMPKFQDVGSYFIGKPDYGWQEQYAGILGQFYFFGNMRGLFLESGTNFLSAEIRYDRRSDTGGSATRISRMGSFLMPHASLNYRFKFGGSPFNMTTGFGFYSYLGLPLVYESYDGSVVQNSEYEPAWRMRLRFDLGWTF